MTCVLPLFALGLAFFAADGSGGGASPVPVTALLVIDIQDFYYPGGALPLTGPEAAGANAAKLLAAARAKGAFIVHVGHNAKAGRGAIRKRRRSPRTAHTEFAPISSMTHC